MQIVLTRDHVSIPWGFRLKGGAEYNVPLSILKVNEGSPSHSKLENGDVIVSIGQYPALSLKHEEALNIIRLFDVTLPLAIRRDPGSFTPPQLPRQTNTSSLVWRPSAYTEQPVAAPAPAPAPISPAGYDPNNYSAYYNNYDSYQQQQQQSMMYQQQTEQIPAVNVQALVQAQVPVKSPKSPYNSFNNNQYRHFNFNTSNTNNNQYQFFNHNNINNNRNPSQPSSPLILQPPPAPPLPAKGFSNPHPVYTPSKIVNSRINEPQMPPTRTYSVNSGFNLKSPLSFNKPNENRSANAHIPDVLVKALNGPPLSVKPFTYTPGGLDLSHVRESSRVKRYDPANPELTHRAPTPSQAISPSFQPQPIFDQQYAPRGQSPLTVNVNMGQEYDNFLTPPHHTKPTMRPFKSTTTKPIKPAPSGPPAPGFSITPQEIVRSKKKEEGKDLANQSYSFRMLNKWIEESEAKPLEMLKNNPETFTAQPTVLNVKKTDVLIAVEEEEKKQRKLQMLQRAKQDGNANVPSKVFKFIDRKYSTDIFVNENTVNENLVPEIAPQHGPASQRSQESGLHKYKGADIPSKSFKQLQNMTRAAEQSSQQQTTFVAQHQTKIQQQETQVHEQVVQAEAPQPEPAAPVAEVVSSLQIEVSAETSSQEASEAAQTVEAESSFVSSSQEVTQETTVNVTQIESTQQQSEAAPPAEQPVEPEKPAEQQIEEQIEAVIETLSQPEPESEPEPAPQAEPEPVPEPEPTPAEPEPATEPEPQPEEEVPQAPAAEPPAAPEPEPQPPSQIEQTVSSDQAQDKNETSDF